MDEAGKITQAAGVVAGATLLSRITGYIRDILIAIYMGAGLAADAFFVAFRIPNTLRRFFAEGAMVISFVPVFTEYLEKRSKEEAFDLAHILFTWLSVFLVLITILGVVFSPLVVLVVAPGFKVDPEKFQLTVLLNRIMFIYILLISLVSLAMGILNAMRHFFAPAVAPVLLNLSMIVTLFILSPFLPNPALCLAVGVVLGGVLQLVLQVPFLLKRGYVPRFRPVLNNPGVKQIVFLWIGALFGVAVYQINVVVGTILASLLPSGSVSYLYYATRLMEFPLGIFSIPLAIAALPSLSKLAADNNIESFRETLNFALRLIFFVSIPAMIGMIVLRVPIVSTLFGWGEFDFATVEKTAAALLAYAAGLWAVGGARVISPAFYAMKDTRTPVILAAISMVVNIILSIVLMGPLLHQGLALANSLAAVVNLALLAYYLKPRVGAIGFRRIITSAAKSLAASVPMGLCAFYLGSLGPWDMPGMLAAKLFYLVLAIVISTAIFIVAAKLVRCEEFSYIYDGIKRRLARRFKK